MPRKKQNQDSGEEAVVGGVAEYADPPSPPPVSKSRKRVFRCQFCAKEFLRNEHLQRHERLRMRPQCGKEIMLTQCQIPRRNLSAAQLALKHSPGGIDFLIILLHCQHEGLT